jgi:hypothetical protein
MTNILKIIGVWENFNISYFVLEATTGDVLPYIIPSYEKDWLEKFLDEKVASINNYPKISTLEKGWRIPQELLTVQQHRLKMWREVRASIDGTIRQCDRVIEDVDLAGTSDHTIEYSFLARSAHIDVVALFCIFQRGIELLERFNEIFGHIANKVAQGGSEYVLDILFEWFEERNSNRKLVKYIRNALCHADDFYTKELRDAKNVQKDFDGNLYRANWLNIANGEIFVGVSPLFIYSEYCESEDEYKHLVSKAFSNNFSITELKALLIKLSKILQYTELDHIFRKRLGL